MADILKNVADNDLLKSRFLAFLVDEETFGIEIRHVLEIVGLQSITEIPETQECIKGIVNLRGRIIPVIDIRLRFKKPQKDYNDRTCIIIASIGGKSIGLIVDSVSEVLTIPEEDIAKKPEIYSKDSRGYVNGIGKIGKQVVVLIDCERLLNEEELDAATENK